MRRGSVWHFYSGALAMLTQCTVTREGNGRWRVAVWHDEWLTLCGEYATRDEAVRISNQIWAHFLEQGWTDLGPPVS
jgi:hypothetical protein